MAHLNLYAAIFLLPILNYLYPHKRLQYYLPDFWLQESSERMVGGVLDVPFQLVKRPWYMSHFFSLSKADGTGYFSISLWPGSRSISQGARHAFVTGLHVRGRPVG